MSMVEVKRERRRNALNAVHVSGFITCLCPGKKTIIMLTHVGADPGVDLTCNECGMTFSWGSLPWMPPNGGRIDA